ncbi:MAG TPA: hypothetical protein VFB45_02455 [Pseudolabrys sp.]|nr:hypothetical protein [Pseudolabrys sp.]
MLDPLLLDLVEWVAKEPRSYAEVMDAWRTSCPRLPVWETAMDRGYLRRRSIDARVNRVVVTETGLAFLRDHGRIEATALG